MQIAICDDFPNVVKQIKNYLLEYEKQSGIAFEINTFSDAESLWEYLKSNSLDLIILDIELVNMNGVELGQLIRKQLADHRVKILYISAKDTYDRQLFDVQPINFLPKPVEKEKLFKTLDLVAELMDEGGKVFTFESKQGSCRIRLRDILYFESFNHAYTVTTLSGTYEFRSTISDILKQLSGAKFIQIHRSYIINYENTSFIKYDEITMTDGKVIPISRDRRKDVRKAIADWERNSI